MSAALPAGLMSPDPCALRVLYVKLSFFFFWRRSYVMGCPNRESSRVTKPVHARCKSETEPSEHTGVTISLSPVAGPCSHILRAHNDRTRRSPVIFALDARFTQSLQILHL